MCLRRNPRVQRLQNSPGTDRECRKDLKRIHPDPASQILDSGLRRKAKADIDAQDNRPYSTLTAFYRVGDRCKKRTGNKCADRFIPRYNSARTHGSGHVVPPVRGRISGFGLSLYQEDRLMYLLLGSKGGMKWE